MPDLLAPQLQFGSGPPDRMIMRIEELGEQEAEYLATEAVVRARQTMPRVSGATANRLQPIFGPGFFGIYFPDSYTWFMEHGTKPFTMRSLAGKVIPMWIDDPTGQERAKNPKARVRLTQDGRQQIQIFRRAARIGQRKIVKRKNKVTGEMETTTTVASYPGAPGRINKRSDGMGWGNGQAGQIARGNVGVRWRHPGLRSMQFLNGAISSAAFQAGLLITTIYATDGASWESLQNRKAV